MFLLELSDAGIVNWHQLLNFPGEERDGRTILLPDGSLAHATNSTSFGNGNQFALSFLNAAGVVQQTRAFGGPGEEITRVVVKSLGNAVLMAGSSDNRLYLVKTPTTDVSGACPYTQHTPGVFTEDLNETQYSVSITDPNYQYASLNVATQPLTLTPQAICAQTANCCN